MSEKGMLKVLNPATNEHIADIEETPLEQVPALYGRARTAYQNWSLLSITERLTYLKHLRVYMVEHIDELAQTIAQDTGKVKMDALVADIMPTLDAIKHIETHAKKVLGRQKKGTPLLLFGKKSYVEYSPRGTVLVISPWNYPLQLAMVPVVSAVISGNAVILKPSEVTPLVGKHMEELFKKAGFPENVIQVAHGGKELGAQLTEGKPDYIFFTGSVNTGRIVQMQAAKHLIPTTLELGGKDPMIVFSDAHLERAVKGAAWGAFTNSGQVCMGTERLYVEKHIYPEFIQLLKKEINGLTQGTEEDHDIGSMTTAMQKEIVRTHLMDALDKGAKLEVGTHPENWSIDRLFIEPILLSQVTNDMKIMQEETFGPVLPVMAFESEEEAIQLANDSAYGLNASVWSTDMIRAERVANQLLSGAVVINDVIITVANHHLPFGGVKESGMGRYHADIGLRTFCHEKAVMMDKGRKSHEVQWYPYRGKTKLFSTLLQSLFGEKRRWPTFINTYLKLLKK